MGDKKLSNLNIVSFESRHAKTLADLISIQGGHPISAPSMKEIPLENNPQVFSFAEAWFAGRIDLLILLTGVGTKAMAEILETKYSKDKIMELLKRTVLVPRGPKPIRVLREWGIPYALTVPEPNTWRELLKTMDENLEAIGGSLQNRTVAIQEYGIPNVELVDELKKRGAKVIQVPVYRWALPDDLKPLESAIQRILLGQVQVAMFTTAIQIEHVFQAAERLKPEAIDRSTLRKALNQVVIASVGPDCSEALRLNGVLIDIEPESPKMGPLVLEVADKAQDVLSRKKRNESDCAIEVPNNVLGISTIPPSPGTRDSVFLKACRREKTPYTPVWLMRQAGRYMKDYRDLRDKNSFLTLCKDPALVAEITVTAQEKLSADAAILFSDILLILEPMGFQLEYVKGDGPLISIGSSGSKKPDQARFALQTSDQVDQLKLVDPKNSLSFVLEGIRQTRSRLKNNIPLIGFAGAPFTVASYMIEGGSSKDFTLTRNFMKKDPGRWKILMEKIAASTQLYLNAQIDAGVEALQIFDSWVGALDVQEYHDFVFPYSKKLMQGLTRVPVIHFGTKNGLFLEVFSEAGGQVIGVDHRVSLADAWKRIGYDKAIQGNLNPEILFQDISAIKKEVSRIMIESGNRPGYIFNLGHGVLPGTPVENVIALVRMVHEYGR